jgi:hypothetical protein
MQPTLRLITAALLSTAALPAAAWAQVAQERVRVILPDRFEGQVRIQLPAELTDRLQVAPEPNRVPEADEAEAGRDSEVDADRLPGVVAPPPPPPPPPGVAFMTRRSYGDLKVLGAGIDEFYYLRQDILLELGAAPSVLPQIEQGGNYGPHPVGSQVRVTMGANYVVFPVCAGAISWPSRRLAKLPRLQDRGEVGLACRP